MPRIDFFDERGGPLGSVIADARGLRAEPPTPALQSLIDAWLRQRREPRAFVAHYNGWSNGYLSARLRRSATVGP